jgi:L-2-hydroxyglutarate oxidase LhgO
MTQRVVVVGAGIVGLAVARRLQESDPTNVVTVFEKEDSVAQHQSGHNSGVIHAGIYYKPGSLKASLTLSGRRALLELCERRAIPVAVCGKVVVALDESELNPLAEIERRAIASNVAISRLDGSGLRALEPHVAGIAGLHSPSTAVVDYGQVANALADEVREAGGTIHLRSAVASLRIGRSGPGEVVTVESESNTLEADRVILCAGLQSDRIAELCGAPPDPQIVPFRGEYYRLRAERTDLVRALVYPVPDPRYPFLGVHFTRRINGEVEIGPNAVLALSREGYHWSDVNGRDVLAMIRSPGFRRLAVRHWQTAAREISGSVAHSVYLRRAQQYIPALTTDDLVKAGSGVRAQAVNRDGSLVDDFSIQRVGPVLAVRNAPSPAATASLAIADYIVTTAMAR